jgi:peroxiredoxin
MSLHNDLSLKKAYRVAGFLALVALLAASVAAQNKIVWNEQEKPIAQQIGQLRQLDDATRAHVTKDLALQIRALPAGPHKLILAGGLASRTTEGDFGRDTLQEVTTTLADALRETPNSASPEVKSLYVELASLERYEHMQASSDDPEYAAAMAKLEADDTARQKADFTLTDLQGKSWHLRDRDLAGKVVLVNFWATWCPPCRKEMPDLEALYEKYKDQGFVILAISDEESAKVSPFIADRKITYPILLDPGSKVHELFVVDGIPKSFVFNREGKLVAQSIDMRTRGQFQSMLAQAGLE